MSRTARAAARALEWLCNVAVLPVAYVSGHYSEDLVATIPLFICSVVAYHVSSIGGPR